MAYHILTFAILLGLAGCSNNSSKSYRQDAARFCNVFSLSSWSEMKAQNKGVKLMEELLRRIDQAVETKEFESILNQQHLQQKNADSLYEYYVREASKLTGEEFSCHDLKVYFQETIQ